MKGILTQLQKKRCILTFFISVFLSISITQGQNNTIGNIGVGGGLSFGGIGARLTYTPIEKLGLFGALGYNLDALGYNLGAQFHLTPKKKIHFYLTGMYGYNTVLIVDAINTKSKTTYYGISAGVGIEFKFTEKSFLSAEVLLPIRPQVYKDAVDDLKSINYEITNPWPVVFCIGYHIKL